MEGCTQYKNDCFKFRNISSTPLMAFEENVVPGNSTNNHTPYSNNSFYEDEQLSASERAAEIFTKTTDVLSILLCVFGILANGVSIVAVRNLRQKMTTHSKLIISLCVSDGLILVAHLFYYIMYILSSWQECIRISIRLTINFAILATLMNLLVMAFDHYGAIMKPLHYRQKMTNILGNIVIIAMWTMSSFGALIQVILGINSRTYPGESLCSAIFYGSYEVEICILGFIFIVLIGIVLIYGRIYIRVKKAMPCRKRARCHTDSGSVKALMTTLLFVGTFVLFWTPLAIYNVYMYVLSITDNLYILQNLERITLISDILHVILLLNAVADPLIYAIRLPKVKRGFVALFANRSQSPVSKHDKNSTKHQQI